MLITKNIKILELFILGFCFPLMIIHFSLSKYIIFFLWIIFLYTVVIYTIFYKKKFKIGSFFSIDKKKKNLIFILTRWIILSITLYYFTKFFFPDKLFSIQKNDISLLYKIFIIYPFLSAFPQEFIFCTYFFKRYKSLFPKEKILIIISAIIFCFAHIFAINWVAPLLSIFGGFIFANTYKKTNSLLIVTIEHALYGNTLFYLGLGWFFWGGSVEFK